MSAASVAQHRLLAAAPRLNCDELSKTEPWLTTVVRRVLANVLPGATPEKRKAPSAVAEGQIQVPGAAPPTSAPASSKRSKTNPSKKAAKASKSDASSSASDVESDSSDASVVDRNPPPPLPRQHHRRVGPSSPSRGSVGPAGWAWS